MEDGVETSQQAAEHATEADLKAALMNLVKLQNLITQQLQLSTGQLAAVTRGINLILSELERRTTINPDRPN